MAKDLKISEMQKTSSPREDAIIPIVEQGMNKSTTVGDIRKPLKDSLNNKQDKLISGTNIKTINGQTVLGEGNITIQNTAGSTDYTSLNNKPRINNIELLGNKTLDELNIQQKGDFANKVTQQNISGTSITQELLPNKFYLFQEVTSLTLTLANPIEGLYNEYMLQFTSGDTPTTLNLPETIKWIGSNLIQSNKTYQISIVNNIAIMGGI